MRNKLRTPPFFVINFPKVVMKRIMFSTLLLLTVLSVAIFAQPRMTNTPHGGMLIKTTNGNMLEMVVRYKQANFYLFDKKENPLAMSVQMGKTMNEQVRDTSVKIQFSDGTSAEAPLRINPAEATAWIDTDKSQKFKATVSFTYKGKADTALFDFDTMTCCHKMDESGMKK
jgi:hypothetical protein